MFSLKNKKIILKKFFFFFFDVKFWEKGEF